MRNLLPLFLLFVLSVGPAAAAYVEVTLLGTGTPRPDPQRFGAATVVEAGGRYFLFDAGRGVTVRLRQAGVPLERVRRVFLTHLHSDHITGLADLWLTGWIWGRPGPLELYGPAGVGELARHLEAAHGADIGYRTGYTGLDGAAASMGATELEGEGVVYDEDGVRIVAFTVDHGPVKPAYGYRLEFRDRVVVISGDTTYSSNLVEHARGADLLVHEIAAADADLLARNPRLGRVMAYHTDPQQMRRMLADARPRATVLNHVLELGLGARQALDALLEDHPDTLHLGQDLLRVGVGETIRFIPPPRGPSAPHP